MFTKVSDCDEYYVVYSVDDISIKEILIKDFRGTKSAFPLIEFNSHIIIFKKYVSNNLIDRGIIYDGNYKYATVHSFNDNGCDRTYNRINDDIEGIILTCNEGLDIPENSLIMKFIKEVPR